MFINSSRISKNLNLRKKSRSQLLWKFPEKPFQGPKIIFKSPRLIGQKSLSYGHLLKDKVLKLTFLGEPTLFTAKEDLNPQKQAFLLNLRLWPSQKLKFWFIFYEKKFL